MSMIPFLDLHAGVVELKQELDEAIQRVLASGRYILGEEVEHFEEEFSDWCGSKYTIGVASGLDAIYLSLRALNVGPGAEVIVPSNTYIATWLAVSQCGATPVPVEPDPDTHTIDPVQIEAAITPKTRGILPVHLYGLPADLDQILSIAARHNLWVLEDAAQAHGARYKGRRIGAHGDAVAWSFYPGKNLGALGDGGAITTSNEALADRLRLLRNYGSRVKYHNEVQGWNSRLDPLQAAILRVKLQHLEEWNARRQMLAEHYISSLDRQALGLPSVPSWAQPAWHLFVVKSRHRADLQEALARKNVETMIHYPIPPHLQDAYRYLSILPGKLPIAEHLSREVLSIPIGPHLSFAQAVEVSNAVNACVHT